MAYGDIDFAFDENVRVAAVEVGEEVEGEDDGAVGGVFEGDDAVGGGACLDGGEDVFNGDLGLEVVFGFGELAYGGLEGVLVMCCLCNDVVR